jgi:C4-dicarboxylate transporter
MTSRVVLDIVASGLGAHVAASTAPMLLTLGINRLAQAAVVAPRALAAGIPFTPEKDGSTFLGGVFGSGNQYVP